MARVRSFRDNKKTIRQHERMTEHIQLTDFAHDGRAIGRANGKPWFIEGAIVGEKVEASSTKVFANRVEAEAKVIETPSLYRQLPVCDKFDRCGGCSLQYLQIDKQREQKDETLKREMSRAISCEQVEWLDPIAGSEYSYRSRARLNIRNGIAGFSGKGSHSHVPVRHCPVLVEALNELLQQLPELPLKRAELEIQVSDDGSTGVHVICAQQPSSVQLIQLKTLIAPLTNGLWVTGANSQRHTLKDAELYFNLEIANQTIRVASFPWQFSQVNQEINNDMVRQAIEWLDLSNETRVLDLFAGSGNFSLSIAKNAASVVGVESSIEAVNQGIENARYNQMKNLTFKQADLFEESWSRSWGKKSFDRILLDPPRAGAQIVCQELGKFDVSRIVYVSCNPATLARDSKILAENGYQLTKARIMDMFPHTGHIESIALFEKGKKKNG